MALTDKRYFYHDTGGKPPADTEIIFRNHSIRHIAAECLNGLELKMKRGVEFRLKDEKGSNHYYVTEIACKKLQEQYKWAWELFFD